MIILDTHAWVWWSADRARLSAAAVRALAATRPLGICAISCWEVAMLAAKGRLRLAQPAKDWLRQALAVPGVALVPLSPEIAAMAADLPLHGDPADRMIAATAIVMKAPLVTKDEKLQGFAALNAIW